MVRIRLANTICANTQSTSFPGSFSTQNIYGKLATLVSSRRTAFARNFEFLLVFLR